MPGLPCLLRRALLILILCRSIHEASCELLLTDGTAACTRLQQSCAAKCSSQQLTYAFTCNSTVSSGASGGDCSCFTLLAGGALDAVGVLKLVQTAPPACGPTAPLDGSCGQYFKVTTNASMITFMPASQPSTSPAPPASSTGAAADAPAMAASRERAYIPRPSESTLVRTPQSTGGSILSAVYPELFNSARGLRAALQAAPNSTTTGTVPTAATPPRGGNCSSVMEGVVLQDSTALLVMPGQGTIGRATAGGNNTIHINPLPSEPLCFAVFEVANGTFLNQSAPMSLRVPSAALGAECKLGVLVAMSLLVPLLV